MSKQNSTAQQTFGSCDEPRPGGALTHLTASHLILDSVGIPILREIVEDFLSLLGTSSAIYEKNGDLAFGTLTTGWCPLVDLDAGRLNGFVEDRLATECGKWPCGEACWADGTGRAVELGEPVEVELKDGMRLYSVPIRAGVEIVGGMNLGYGEPPRSAEKLHELSLVYGVREDELRAQAEAYRSRAAFLIQVAKRQLHTAARLIGEMVQRKRGEDDLRVNRERLALAQTAGQSGTFDWDIRNDVITWPREIQNLYGVVPGELGGNFEAWESLVFPEDLDRLRAAVRESVDSGEFVGEWRVRRSSDGQVRWLAARGKLVSDEAGRPTRMLGINVDITERKQAERALRHSEERYHALVAAGAQIVWTRDPEGVGTDVDSWRAFTGQSEDQARGPGWMAAIHPEDRERTAVLWAEALRTKSTYETEYRLRRHDGEFRHVTARSVPVRRADGSIREWVGACTDITERKRAEECLAEKTRELERSNAELRQFAYVASHDLQEPLRTVANFTQLLAERYGPQLDDDAREFMAFAIGGATQMKTLIQDLLAYSRVGTQGSHFAPVDCNEALGRAVANLHTSIAESGVLVTHEPLPNILADAGQLVQLFQNLISNGIKFKGSNLPRVHIAAARKAGDWVFSVRDNGIGIDPQYAERIFIVFQRLHRSEDYPGTGIGLALCRKIVERHGGKIWVESKPGEGSEFFFSIPAVGEKAAAAGEPAS